MTTPAEDIPELVYQEMQAAQASNIPPADQPRYVADRIRQRIGGAHEYTRKRPMSPAQRAAEIRRRFNGRNLPELAKEFDLSLRRAQQIVFQK